MALELLWHYEAKVTGVYDGDNITVDIDLGFNCQMKGVKIRLAGITAPIMREPTIEAAKAARDFLSERILGKNVLIKTCKDERGEWGRYLGCIYVDGESINDAMVEAGHAVREGG